MDSHRINDWPMASSHRDAAAGRKGSGSGGTESGCNVRGGTLRPWLRHLEDDRKYEHASFGPHRNTDYWWSPSRYGPRHWRRHPWHRGRSESEDCGTVRSQHWYLVLHKQYEHC